MASYSRGSEMFWKKKRLVENRGGEKAKAAIKKIEGPLWGYMVTQRGVPVDTLQRMRRVERDGKVGSKPATIVRIFNPAAAEKGGVVIDSYESLDAYRGLILYDGYYRGSEMADIHIGRAVHVEEKT
jgi:hypothetical protein